jgi:hypothetical protein
MPRFVLLRHELPPENPRPSHFDLMLEQTGALRTWACERMPATAEEVLADDLADHRLTYLDYEGPVSGNRGSVTRVDAGSYEPLAISPDVVRVRIAGVILRGILTLTRATVGGQRWIVGLSPESRSD